MRSQQTAAGVSWLCQQDPQQVCAFFCLLSFYGAFLCRNWVYAPGCISKILNRSLSFSVFCFCVVCCLIQTGYTPLAASARSSTGLFLFLFSLCVCVWCHALSGLGRHPWLCQQDPQQDTLFFCLVFLYGPLLHTDPVYAHGCVSKILNKTLSFLFGLFVWSVASYRSGIRPWLCQQDPEQVSFFLFALFCMVRCFI